MNRCRQGPNSFTLPLVVAEGILKHKRVFRGGLILESIAQDLPEMPLFTSDVSQHEALRNAMDLFESLAKSRSAPLSGRRSERCGETFHFVKTNLRGQARHRTSDQQVCNCSPTLLPKIGVPNGKYTTTRELSAASRFRPASLYSSTPHR